MARSQEELQGILEEILSSTKPAVFFQKPLNVTLPQQYIVYDIDNDWVEWADNKPWVTWFRYSATIVTRAPDSPLPGQLQERLRAAFDRKFISGGLHHFVYSFYF